MKENYTINVIMQNNINVINRVLYVFARRRISIKNLRTEDLPGNTTKRMIIAITEDPIIVAKVLPQIQKIIDVLSVSSDLESIKTN